MAQNFHGEIEDSFADQTCSMQSMKLDDFEKAQDLGRGQFGRVFAATHIPTGATVAIKVSFKNIQ